MTFTAGNRRCAPRAPAPPSRLGPRPRSPGLLTLLLPAFPAPRYLLSAEPQQRAAAADGSPGVSHNAVLPRRPWGRGRTAQAPPSLLQRCAGTVGAVWDPRPATPQGGSGQARRVSGCPPTAPAPNAQESGALPSPPLQALTSTAHPHQAPNGVSESRHLLRIFIYLLTRQVTKSHFFKLLQRKKI